MPINMGQDKNGSFVRWGNQKKYYYKNDKSFIKACNKALRQQKAIKSNLKK
jgi:hypothetical protein